MTDDEFKNPYHPLLIILAVLPIMLERFFTREIAAPFLIHGVFIAGITICALLGFRRTWRNRQDYFATTLPEEIPHPEAGWTAADKAKLEYLTIPFFWILGTALHILILFELG